MTTKAAVDSFLAERSIFRGELGCVAMMVP